jgi:hypothetical protein
MRSFVQWLDEEGFWVKESWDAVKGEWAGAGLLKLEPHQKVILDHCLTPNETGRLPYTTVLLSAPKKSGKTALAAAIATWFAHEIEPGSECFVIANDQEQAEARVLRDVRYHMQHQTGLSYPTDRVELKNGTFIQAIAKEYKSAAGSRHSLTVWDELWAYMCIAPGTKVLRGDLTWVPAETLQPGDPVISFDEGQMSYHRSYRIGRVTRTGLRTLPAQLVRLSNGKEFTCTPNHKWLIRPSSGQNRVVWAETDNLRKGDKLMRVLDMGGLGTLPARVEKGLDNLGRMDALEWVSVVEVVDLTDQPMVTLQTDKKTFIAEGYATHNSEGSRRTYSEMTPIPTVRHSLRVIVTYAGFENESDLLWELYTRGVGPEEHKDGKGTPLGLELDGEPLPCWKRGRQFTYWDHVPRMPWQSDAFIAEQDDLRPSDMLRLWGNHWVSNRESFIPPDLWTAAEKHYDRSAEVWEDHPYRLFPIWLGVDVGIKNDCLAVVGTTYDPAKGDVIQMFHHIWTPQPDDPIDLEMTAEAWILRLKTRFKITGVAADPYQFSRSMKTLQNAGLRVEEVVQNTDVMIRASQNFFNLLRRGQYHTYPDEEAATHIRNTVAVETSRGYRIAKDKTNISGRALRTRRWKKYIDFTVAASISALYSIEMGGVGAPAPIVIVSPFTDSTRLGRVDRTQLALPFELRS